MPTSAGRHERDPQVQHAGGAGGLVPGPRRRLLHGGVVDQREFVGLGGC